MENYPNIDVLKADSILHGITNKGELLLGLDAIAYAWRCVGKGWLYAPTRLPLIKPIADWLYLKFAKHRMRLSRIFGFTPQCSSKTCKK